MRAKEDTAEAEQETIPTIIPRRRGRPVKKEGLLQRAMRVQTQRQKRPLSDEERELAMAWVRGEVNITQVAAALQTRTGGVYPFLANALKEELAAAK